jgi:hypothetical protein
MSEPLENTRALIAIIRDGALTGTITVLLALFLVWPTKLRTLLKNAGIKAIKFGDFELDLLEEVVRKTSSAMSKVEHMRKTVNLAKSGHEGIDSTLKQLRELGVESGFAGSVDKLGSHAAESKDALTELDGSVREAESALKTAVEAQRRLLAKVKDSG